MTSSAEAGEAASALEAEVQTGEALDFQALMDAYAAAATTPFPSLVVTPEDYARFAGQWGEYAEACELSEFDRIHYERFKGAAAMFGPFLGSGPAIELGKPSAFTGFITSQGVQLDSYEGDPGRRLDLESDAFELVVCLEVVSDLGDAGGADGGPSWPRSFRYGGVMSLLAESYRVLRPGGALLLSAANATSVDAIARILRGEHPHLFDPHVREYAPIQIKAFAERVGFRLEAFGTFFAWQTAAPLVRDRLLEAIADLGYEPGNRGDDACYVLRKPAGPDESHVAFVPGIDDFDAMVGRSAEDTASYWQERHLGGVIPEYEDVLRKVYERFIRPGDVVVDVGVNIGRHFTRFNELVGGNGRVIGFEPVPDFAAHSRALVGPTAEIREKAVSDNPGTGEFLFMTNAVGESGFKERASEGNRGAKPIQVEISTLDAELASLSSLRYIKIDTEGHEISVLRGGRETIRRLRPIVSVEWGEPTYSLYGHNRFSLFDLAVEFDYKLADLFGNIVVDREEWGRISDKSYWDYFMVPAEQTESWRTVFVAGPVPSTE